MCYVCCVCCISVVSVWCVCELFVLCVCAVCVECVLCVCMCVECVLCVCGACCVVQLLSYLDILSQFLEVGHFTSAQERVLLLRLEILVCIWSSGLYSALIICNYLKLFLRYIF